MYHPFTIWAKTQTCMHSEVLSLQRDSSSPAKFKNWGLVLAPLDMLQLLSSWHFSNTSISKILPQEVHVTTCFHHLALCTVWFLKSEKQKARCVSSVCRSNYVEEATINTWVFSLFPTISDNSECAVQPVVFYSRLPYFTFWRTSYSIWINFKTSLTQAKPVAQLIANVTTRKLHQVTDQTG